MVRRVAVGDVMTRTIAAVPPNASLYDCARKLITKRVNTLLVTKKEVLLGIITARDILWAMTKRPNLSLRDIEVKDVAVKKVAVIKPAATVAEAFEKMKQHKFRRLPVLSRGKVVGILTLKDILSVDPQMYHDAQDLLNIPSSDDGPNEQEGFCEGCGQFETLLSLDGKTRCMMCHGETR